MGSAILLLSKSEISILEPSGCTARFVSDLVVNPEDRFSHNEAQIIGMHEQSQTGMVMQL